MRRKQSVTDKKGSNANTISPEGITINQFNLKHLIRLLFLRISVTLLTDALMYMILDTKKMMIKLKDLQAQQQKQQEKSKQSIHDPMPSSILHPQQNPTSSKVNLNTALLLGEQQPPNISMISDMLPHDYSSSTNKSNGKNSNPKIKQRKVYNTVFLVLIPA